MRHSILRLQRTFWRLRAEWRALAALLGEVNSAMEQSIELADEAIAHCRKVGARADEMLAWGRHGRT
ncbi:hypothetical protein E4L96_05835 [Massilia arenosa]|uniref:Uncharacterized protein n=1 Tax=Zemynaea arenosa TaxID=2561931 RepID=A0A4Y9SHT2_9BURK|nr:hypothetical protein [Massilia arenosa]TFW24685.1 hypothetical protein E4L96_05835 [Massilia arenosa]